MKENNEILILGIGNEILTDDGIGPKLVNKLKLENNFKKINFNNVFLGGLDILDLVRDYQTVIFIDAIKTKNGVPGSVYTFTTNDFRETIHLSNFHDTSFLTALELGKQIGISIPNNIFIIAIEIVEDLTFSDEFSPEIKKKYNNIYKEVKNIIKEKLKL